MSLKVLVVEDERYMRKDVRDLLAEQGVEEGWGHVGLYLAAPVEIPEPAS